MHVVQVDAGLHDQTKLLEAAAPLGQPGLVVREIPGNDQRRAWGLLREDSAAPEVGDLVDDRRLATLEVGVAALGEFSSGTGRVAGVAMVKNVDQVAAKSHQSTILARQVQRNRCDLEANANPGLLAVVLGERPRSSTHGPNSNHRCERGSCCQSVE